jgi:hypothetical protein
MAAGADDAGAGLAADPLLEPHAVAPKVTATTTASPGTALTA